MLTKATYYADTFYKMERELEEIQSESPYKDELSLEAKKKDADIFKFITNWARYYLSDEEYKKLYKMVYEYYKEKGELERFVRFIPTNLPATF